jgi:polyhydroxybutyrate depolymerase
VKVGRLVANLDAHARVLRRMHTSPHISRRVALRTTLACALAAAALAPAAASAAPSAPACPSVGTPYELGANCRTIDVDGYPRQFIVYYPERLTDDGGRPVVFMYHGSGETGEYFLRMSGWRQLADATGLIAVFPTGLRYPDLDTGKPITKWNDGNLAAQVDLSGAQPPGYPATAPWPADDVGFTDGMLADIEANLPVDTNRVYAAGFSNGANFTARLAAERSTVLAAAGMSAGKLQLPEVAARAIPTIMAAGSLDDRILDQTGPPPLTELPMDPVDLLAVPIVADTIDTEADLLGLDPADYGTLTAPHATELHWPASGDALMRFMVIEGLQHRWGNGANNPAGFRAAETFWRFFEANPLP